jgi:hypothetical protein
VLKFLLVVVLIAGVVYAVMWTLERRRAAGSGAERGASRRSRPHTRPAAPDDDEDFLRWLDRKRRKDSPDS